MRSLIGQQTPRTSADRSIAALDRTRPAPKIRPLWHVLAGKACLFNGRWA